MSGLVALVAAWFVAGGYAYARLLAYDNGEWPALAYDDLEVFRALRLIAFVSGPIGVLGAIAGTFGSPYGLRFRRISRADARAAHLRQFPSLPLPVNLLAAPKDRPNE